MLAKSSGLQVMYVYLQGHHVTIIIHSIIHYIYNIIFNNISSITTIWIMTDEDELLSWVMFLQYMQGIPQ